MQNNSNSFFHRQHKDDHDEHHIASQRAQHELARQRRRLRHVQALHGVQRRRQGIRKHHQVTHTHTQPLVSNSFFVIYENLFHF